LWIDGFSGLVAVERVDFDTAIATCRRVLDRASGRATGQASDQATGQATGRSRERIADFALECLTLALIRGERWTEAEPPARRLVARLTERNGAEHPNTIYARLKLATVHYHGDRPHAELEANAVIADLTRLFGPDSPHLMEALSVVANTEMELSGQTTERSLHAAKQALEIGERILPPDDAKLARLYWIWAAELTAMFDPVSHKQITRRIAEARDAYQRAMAIYERRREDFEWAKLAMAIAQMDRDDHACARALAPLHQVASMADAGRLPPAMGVAARAETGVCQLAAGDPTSAATALAAAVTAFDKTDIESAAQYRLWWAEAQWKLGRFDDARRIAREVKSKLPADTDLRRAFHRQADDWYLAPKPGVRDE
jgi:tetratricopeptide (TPR) repeat protein